MPAANGFPIASLSVRMLLHARLGETPPKSPVVERDPQRILPGFKVVTNLIDISGSCSRVFSSSAPVPVDGLPIPYDSGIEGCLLVAETKNSVFQAFFFPAPRPAELDIQGPCRVNFFRRLWRRYADLR